MIRHDEEAIRLISRGFFTGKGHISRERRRTKIIRMNEDFTGIWHLDIHAT